jgi:hypothetical protein
VSLFPTQKSKRPVTDRKNERELFFWTCERALVLTRNFLAVILLAASVTFAIVAMFHGDLVLSSSLLR